MSPVRDRRVVAAACLLMLAGGARGGTPAAGSAPATPPLPGAAYRARGAAAGSDGAATLTKDGVTTHVREIAGVARAALIREVTGAAADPFAVMRGKRPFFRTFLVEIENGGAAEVLFNSALVALHTGDGRVFPHGFGELYSVLSEAIPDEAALSRLAGILEETPISVLPGGRGRKLLVFDRVPDAKRLRLELAGLQAGAQELGGRIEFERVPRE